jgi:2-dehydropantoate 2-reductase
MKICVFGAGAGGGHLAVRLAVAGHDVSVVARGPHLDAIRTNGLALHIGDQTLSARLKASDKPADLGAQDVVIVTTKATALRSVTQSIAPLVGERTILVFPQNGMPWWYPVGLPREKPAPPAVPNFSLASAFTALVDPRRICGGVIYSANVVDAPGVVVNKSPEFNRFVLGPVVSDARDQCEHVRATLDASGIDARTVPDIRDAMWRKLIANITGSIIALVTASTSGQCRRHAGLRHVFHGAVAECRAIAAAHGFPLSDMINSRQMLDKLLDHRPSILQDYEQNRPMEIGEIVLAPLAFARVAGLATPTLDVLASIASTLAANRGLFDPDEWSGVQVWEHEPALPAAAQ